MLNAIITANREDFLLTKKDIRNEYGCDLVSLGPKVGKEFSRRRAATNATNPTLACSSCATILTPTRHTAPPSGLTPKRDRGG